MARHFERAMPWYLPVVLAAVVAGPADAQNRWRTDCNRLMLISVNELPDGSEVALGFQGTCVLLQGHEGSLQTVAQINVRAEAIWKPAVGELLESVASDGPAFKGYMTLKLHCDRNPVLERADCSRLDYSNTTGWRGFGDFMYRAQPVTRGRASPNEVAALRASSGGAGPSITSQPSRPAERENIAPEGTTREAENPATETDSIWVVVPLVSGARIVLADTRIIAAREEAGILRWAILGRDGTMVLRLFPEGSRTMRSGFGAVVVDYGAGVYEAGRVKTSQLHLPRPQ